MKITIQPAPLKGAITPPPSKSQAHRAIIAAALAGGGTITNLADSQDITATQRCMAALGELGGLPRLDCGESGSTLRFLIPIALALRGGGIFTGRGRLMERPQTPYQVLFQDKGIAWRQEGQVLTVQGSLTPGRCPMRGDVSSQFITGLLYALPLLAGDSEIVLTTSLESQGYVDLTLEVLSLFGIQIDRRETGFWIPGGQRYIPRDLAVEADWSQAAFWYAAAGTGSAVQVMGMNADSRQGDRIITAWKPLLDGPEEITLDVSGCPDLVPPLAAWAALRAGRTTHMVNAARLRLKESDRLTAVTQVLNALGGVVEEGADCLTIHGRERLSGGTVSAHNDHRIAMMAAVAAARCTQSVTIQGAECVAKSYPGFWDDYAALGGRLSREEDF